MTERTPQPQFPREKGGSMSYLQNWRNYSTTLIPRCYWAKAGPCMTHTFHFRYLPHWFMRWFIRTFIVSTCARTTQ